MSDRTRSEEGQPASEGDGAERVANGTTSSPGNGRSATETTAPEEPATLGQALFLIEKLRADLAERDEQIRGTEERQLRDRAELENFKRRMQREKSESLRYASEGLIRDLLPVADNLERAVRAASETRSTGGDVSHGAAEALVTGVEMVLRQLGDVLDRAGVARVQATPGQPFDPAVHEAVVQAESANAPPGSVVDELAPGYRFHDRLLRAAQVSVAKPPTRLEN